MKTSALWIGAATCLVLAQPAPAAMPPPDPLTFTAAGATLHPFLSDRTRVETVNWFDPGRGGADEDYTFFANVVRFGTTAQKGDFQLVLEGQEVELFDVPNDAGALGPGATYFSNTGQGDQREVFVRRGLLQWSNAGVEGLTLSGGRFLFNDGLETTPKDASLAWLKKFRIGARLLGTFDYTHAGRSFDGGVVRYGHGPYDLTFMGGVPNAGGFNISANNDIGNVSVVYAALTATEPTWLPRSDGRLFYLYYSDDRGVVMTDNRPLPVRTADGSNLAIHTIGANVAGVHRLGPGDVDFLLWAAGQTGQWQTLDHAAWALSLEAGYRLVDVAGKPWIRGGWFRGSGDDNPNDGDHGTFFQVLPTARIYAQTPFYNMMNNDDLFVEFMVSPWDRFNTRIDYHHLRVAEGADLLYGGGGATMSKPIFGYSGFSARGHQAVGDFLDFSFEVPVTPNVKTGLYYGHVFGSSVIDGQFPGSSALDYGYFEITLTI